MSSLAVLVECDANAWGAWAEGSGVLPSNALSSLLRSVVTFSNSHLSLSAANRLLVYGYAQGLSKKLLYDSSRSDSPDSSSSILSSLRDALRESMQHSSLGSCPPLAASLTLALCQLRKSATDPVSNKPRSGRVVVVSLSPEFGRQHSLLMNLFFSAHNHGIPVYIVSLGGPSALLQQAADITSGVFVSVPSADRILPALLTQCLVVGGKKEEETQSSVDYRAACFCHQNLVPMGYVCSVCLSVLCSFAPICPACNSVFKISAMPRRTRKRKTDAP